MNTVNEKSTAYVEATFRDKNAALAVPSAARYRVDCITTNTAITAWSVIAAPGSVKEIVIKPSETLIISDGNAQEIKRVTVEATYGADDSIYDEYDITVMNLSGVDALT